MARLVIILFTGLFLAACTQPGGPSQQDTFGIIDTVAIAGDTTMQKGMEVSYEYHQTLPITEQEVYDVLAWGKPSDGHVMLVRRTKAEKDTVLITERHGQVLNGWTSDLNKNGFKEIMLLTRYANAPVQLIACELTKAKEPTKLTYENGAGIAGWDSIYYDEKKGELIRAIATYHTADDSTKTESGKELRPYTLSGTTIKPSGSKSIFVVYDSAKP